MNFDDFFISDENYLVTDTGGNPPPPLAPPMIDNNFKSVIHNRSQKQLNAGVALIPNRGGTQSKRVGVSVTSGGDLADYCKFHKTPITRNSYIIDAISGHSYPYLVGSIEEKLLFKIGLSNGQSKTSRIVHNEIISEPTILFYDSPEQFERHTGCSINPENKQRWHERRDAARQWLYYENNVDDGDNLMVVS